MAVWAGRGLGGQQDADGVEFFGEIPLTPEPSVSPLYWLLERGLLLLGRGQAMLPVLLDSEGLVHPLDGDLLDH
jgi:hypothetical protein